MKEKVIEIQVSGCVRRDLLWKLDRLKLWWHGCLVTSNGIFSKTKRHPHTL